MSGGARTGGSWVVDGEHHHLSESDGRDVMTGPEFPFRAGRDREHRPTITIGDADLVVTVDGRKYRVTRPVTYIRCDDRWVREPGDAALERAGRGREIATDIERFYAWGFGYVTRLGSAGLDYDQPGTWELTDPGQALTEAEAVMAALRQFQALHQNILERTVRVGDVDASTPGRVWWPKQLKAWFGTTYGEPVGVIDTAGRPVGFLVKPGPGGKSSLAVPLSCVVAEEER